MPHSSVDVRSPDTDVFILLMDLCARNQVTGPINFTTGQGKFHRTIASNDRCASTGLQKSKALIGLHALSDANWGGKFFGLSKKKWITTFLKLSISDQFVNTLQDLDE